MTTTTKAPVPTPPERVFDSLLGAVSSYDASSVTPSTHIEKFVADHKLEQSTGDVVRDVLLGIERYAKLLSITVDGFYQRYSGDLIRDDHTLYTIFTYLLIFLDQSSCVVSWSDLQHMLAFYSRHHPMLPTLLTFLFKECLSSNDWLPAQWSLVYDRQYVDDVLLSNMRTHAPTILSFVHNYSSDSGGGGGGDNNDENSSTDANKREKRRRQQRQRRRRRKTTEPKPFNLTSSQSSSSSSSSVSARQLAKQEQQALQASASAVTMVLPAPGKSTTLAELEAEHVERLQRIRADTQQRHAKARAPRLTAKAAPPLQPEMPSVPKARPAPPVTSVPPPRYTTATILQMDARIRRKQEEEAAVIRAYESELRDTSEFDAWQQEMRERDDRARALEVERRRVEMSQAAADAQRAVEVQLEQKRVEVEAMRRATEEQMAAKQRADAEELERARERALAMQAELEKAAALAQTQVLKEKKKAAAKIVNDRKAAARRAEKRRRKEMKEKRALIVEIQAMERIASEKARRPKLVDPSATSGLGLMGEMSLIELRERLVHLKLQQELEVREKRRTIVREMEAKKRMLEAKLKNVEGFMQLQQTTAQQQRHRRGSGSGSGSGSPSSVASPSSSSLLNGGRLPSSTSLPKIGSARRQAALKLVERIKKQREDEQHQQQL